MVQYQTVKIGDGDSVNERLRNTQCAGTVEWLLCVQLVFINNQFHTYILSHLITGSSRATCHARIKKYAKNYVISSTVRQLKLTFQ